MRVQTSPPWPALSAFSLTQQPLLSSPAREGAAAVMGAGVPILSASEQDHLNLKCSRLNNPLSILIMTARVFKACFEHHTSPRSIVFTSSLHVMKLRENGVSADLVTRVLLLYA